MGFGAVYLCKDTYYRYIVSKKENLIYLINIYNHRLRLNKTQKRYINWVKSFNQYYNYDLQVDNVFNQINLNDAWLSGFIDAEGCFSASQRSGRSSFRMRFTLKQKDEYEKLLEIKNIWCEKIDLLKHKDIAILSMDTLKSLKYLISYLKQFPLKSNKNIAYNKWLKLYRVVEEGGRGKSYEEIKLMAQNINKFENEDKVQKNI